MSPRSYEKAKEWMSRGAAGGVAPPDDLTECGLEDLSAALSQLGGLVHDLTSLAECAARMARNNASQINQSVGNADDAATAVELLAKDVSADGESLKVAARDAVRMSFNTTVQMVGARSSAQRLAETLHGVLELARETQGFADALRDRIDAGEVRDDATGRLRCFG